MFSGLDDDVTLTRVGLICFEIWGLIKIMLMLFNVLNLRTFFFISLSVVDIGAILFTCVFCRFRMSQFRSI